MPALGWDSVTVPGQVSAWSALSKRFGKLAFTKLFEPAIRYAEQGFKVRPSPQNVGKKQLSNLKIFLNSPKLF